MTESSLTVVIGFGITGQSVARHLSAQHQDFAVIDTRPCPVSALPAQGEYYWESESWPAGLLERAAQVVVSPGLSPQHPLVSFAQTSGLPLCSDIDLFMTMTEAPVIGVTGTNGKSTVVSLVGHLLNAQGLACEVGGNLGPPALDLLSQHTEVYVLELSSFQLAYSGDLALASAGLLNIGDDHSDWHGSAANYAEAKCRIYGDAAYRVGTAATPTICGVDLDAWIGLNSEANSNTWRLGNYQGKRWIYYEDQPLLAEHELPLSGAHNTENCLWALALVKPWIEPKDAVQGLSDFAPLPHRFASVPGPAGLHCIDDSKATNVDAALAALRGFERNQSLLLIAGGDSKGADLSPLGDAMRGRVKTLYSLGVDAPRVNDIAQRHGVEWHQVESMDRAVALAMGRACAGDTLLLSPACASLDMYENFAQRGDHFAAVVSSYVDFEITGGDVAGS